LQFSWHVNTRRDPAAAPDPEATQSLRVMIVGTYREMPGLRLNISQAVRLFGVGPQTCRAVLDDLVRSGELWMPRAGLYSQARL
jgi:hypothetical protein